LQFHKPSNKTSTITVIYHNRFRTIIKTAKSWPA